MEHETFDGNNGVTSVSYYGDHLLVPVVVEIAIDHDSGACGRLRQNR
jgi:hypothetical protein